MPDFSADSKISLTRVCCFSYLFCKYLELLDFINAAAYVPKGVICLMSAARYQGLTDFLPDVIDMVIDRKKKVSTLPDWLEIKVFYFNLHV